jgi:hypothetical protein
MPIQKSGRFLDDSFRDKLNQVQALEVLFHPGDQRLGCVVRQVALSLSLPDGSSEFDSRQSENGQRVTAGIARKPDHLVGSWLAHIELHQGAGIKVVEAQSLPSLAQNSC